MTAGALFCGYGPFNYGGRFTNASNVRFDAAHALARRAGTRLLEGFEMPANNRCITRRLSAQGSPPNPLHHRRFQ